MYDMERNGQLMVVVELILTVVVITLHISVCKGWTNNKVTISQQPQQHNTLRYQQVHIPIQNCINITNNWNGRLQNCILKSSSHNHDIDGNNDNVNNIQLYEIEEPTQRNNKAFDQQTPHSGRHFIPSHPKYTKQKRKWNIISRLLLLNGNQQKRFTEGWYYRLTIPNTTVSFAFIISIEDAIIPKSKLKLACIQIIGPNDEYIIQADTNVTKFWGWKSQQALGYIFSYNKNNFITSNNNNYDTVTALQYDHWNQIVESGFQILPTSFIGKIQGHDGTRKGGIVLHGTEIETVERYECNFDFTINPICGWGGGGGGGSSELNNTTKQKSTAGWLSSYPLFEPHWQITLADARATGIVTWKNTTYNFTNVPFYSEKNWGSSLPKKWYWTQCNSFNGYEQLSVVAGGGIRDIPFLRKSESLGMVTVHYNNTMYEAVPWLGGMDWNVSQWGYWKLCGNNTFCDTPFDVEVIYTIDTIHNNIQGLVFRAPTKDDGMVRFCRDTFVANVTVNLWNLLWDKQQQKYVRGTKIINNAYSTQGGAEIGGSPWWDDWIGQAQLQYPIRTLLRLPYKIEKIKQRIIHRYRSVRR